MGAGTNETDKFRHTQNRILTFTAEKATFPKLYGDKLTIFLTGEMALGKFCQHYKRRSAEHTTAKQLERTYWQSIKI